MRVDLCNYTIMIARCDQCLAVYQLFSHRVSLKLHFRFVRKHSSFSLTPSARRLCDLYANFAFHLPYLSLPVALSIPFGFSLRLLRLFHSVLPPSSRGNSRATLAVDINKHLDYTVKATSTTSPD